MLKRYVFFFITYATKYYEQQDDSDDELSFESALEKLQETFGKYIKVTVLQKVQLADMEIFYIGIPVKKFPDFDKLTQYIVDGKQMLSKAAENEANEEILKKTEETLQTQKADQANADPDATADPDADPDATFIEKSNQSQKLA